MTLVLSEVFYRNLSHYQIALEWFQHVFRTQLFYFIYRISFVLFLKANIDFIQKFSQGICSHTLLVHQLVCYSDTFG